MAQRNRNILKSYFQKGSRPTQENFRDLIDSAVNVLEDGFSRSLKDGIKLAPVHDSTAILSVYKDSGAETPSWSLELNKNEDLSLHRNIEKETGTFLKMKNDSIELSANNITLSGLSTRQGAPIPSGFDLRANGKWQDITEELYGIHAFEIVAGFEIPQKQQNFVLLAWASHCYGVDKRINTIGPNRACWGNKLLLRWVKVKDKNKKQTLCKLQIRTKRNYGGSEKISCYITHLWKNNQRETQTG